MNDRFNKDFADIFGDFTKQATLDPMASARNCIAPRGMMMTGAKSYPGSVGARQPVPGVHGGMVRGQEPLIVKSGHTSITRLALRHKGQP
jgi:hypothetical protein